MINRIFDQLIVKHSLGQLSLRSGCDHLGVLLALDPNWTVEICWFGLPYSGI